MKTLVKMTIIAAALIAATPAFAGESRPTKGTKSYQIDRSDAKTEQTAEAKTADDVQNIAPAAGDTQMDVSEGKSMKEEIRLPRKN